MPQQLRLQPNSPVGLWLCLLQLGILLYQLFQAESWKLYRNLGVFPIAFAPVDRAFTIFGVSDALARLESSPSSCCGHLYLRPAKLLATRGKELGNVVDGVISRPGVRRTLLRLRTAILRTLIFVLVSVVAAGSVIGFGVARFLRRAQILHELLRNLLKKSRGDTGFRHVGTIAAAIARTRQHQCIHGSRHTHVTEAAFFFDVVGCEQRSRVREKPFLKT